MHSFLIISKNKENAKEKALKFLKDKDIDRLDISFFESEKQIGIPDIKTIQQNIYLKPIKSKEKAIVISAIQGLTIEAQNSLLKLLEEPPANTIIVLLIESIDLVLPTIKSRCNIIELNNRNNENNDKYINLLSSLEKAGIGEKLKIAQDLSRNKDKALNTIEKIIIILREKILEKQDKELINKIKSLQKTHTIIKNTNTNLRLALENLFLNF